MEKNKIDKPLKLLWSGGWDSTFRLLEILMIEKKTVQPYYIIAPGFRRSIAKEQTAQKKISQLLIKDFPESKPRILPTILVHVSDIKPDSEIEEAYWVSNKILYLGPQYEFMARYCKQNEITGMEICVQKSLDPNWRPRFIPFVERRGDSHKFDFNPDLAYRPEYSIMKYFHFPVLGYTKQDMYQIAKEQGWMKIMGETWFCYTPFFGRIPCGVCVPCMQSIGEGMGWRIPFYSRYLSKVWDTKLVQFARKLIKLLSRKQRKLHNFYYER